METGRRFAGLVRAAVMGLLWCNSALIADAAVVLGGTPSTDVVYQVPLNTIGVRNPSFTFQNVPEVGDLTVSFGTHFVGQVPGSMPNSLIDSTPTPPLQLASNGTYVQTMFDFSHPNHVALGGVQGTSLYTTPLAILFDEPVNFVSFNLGHLDAASPTQIQAFDANGASLGIFGGLPMGHNSLTLVETNETNVISGISIYIPGEGMDWEGFGISDVSFGLDDGDTDGGGNPVVPEPATLVVWSVLGVAGTASVWFSRRRKRGIPSEIA